MGVDREREVCTAWDTSTLELADTTKRTMQSFVDSVCRCLGTQIPHRDDGDENMLEKHIGVGSSTGSPDARSRRMNRLELQDKQWDALFEDHQGDRNFGKGGYGSNFRASSKNSRGKSGSPVDRVDRDRGGSSGSSGRNPSVLEQAQAVSKAKMAANPSRHKAHKRKRSLKSRDDIFRQRRNYDNSMEGTGCGAGENNGPISRLANHPAVVNALCFATPINEDFDQTDNHSLTSDTNTLNTCEDTINSMFYLETTQLANVVEKRPPMPLFDQFQVRDSSISNIVATDSHSSLKMLYHPKQMATVPAPRTTMSSIQHNRNNIRNSIQSSGGRVPVTISSSDEEMPPPVTASSGSDSSGRRY